MKIRFGMIITDGVGKAGGQCIQRRGNTRVLRNITIPTQRNGSTNNPQRFVNNYVFSSWGKLTQSARNKWADVAVILKGKDVFGNEKSYTPRECYSMCNGVAFRPLRGPVDVNIFDYSVPVLDISSIVINVGGEAISINPSGTPEFKYIQLKAKKITNLSQNPLITKLKTFFYAEDFVSENSVYAGFIAAFPEADTNDIYLVASRGINSSGLVSPWQTFQCVLL